MNQRWKANSLELAQWTTQKTDAKLDVVSHYPYFHHLLDHHKYTTNMTALQSMK